MLAPFMPVGECSLPYSNYKHWQGWLAKWLEFEEFNLNLNLKVGWQAEPGDKVPVEGSLPVGAA